MNYFAIVWRKNANRIIIPPTYYKLSIFRQTQRQTDDFSQCNFDDWFELTRFPDNYIITWTSCKYRLEIFHKSNIIYKWSMGWVDKLNVECICIKTIDISLVSWDIALSRIKLCQTVNLFTFNFDLFKQSHCTNLNQSYKSFLTTYNQIARM